MMPYRLGSDSIAQLHGVNRELVEVVKLAIKITKQDFSVHDGLRTVAQQRELVRRGASKTMKSKHLPQRDGYGAAVDLVPYINGQMRWEWEPIYMIASAVHSAALALGVRLVWGGVWDRPFTNLPGSVAGLKQEVRFYTVRHPGTDFIDGPHYQLGEP